jgi:hypothetical protein
MGGEVPSWFNNDSESVASDEVTYLCRGYVVTGVDAKGVKMLERCPESVRASLYWEATMLMRPHFKAVNHVTEHGTEFPAHMPVGLERLDY